MILHAFVLIIIDYRQGAEENYKDLEVLIQQQVLDQSEIMTALNIKLKESKKAGDTLHNKVMSTKMHVHACKYTFVLYCKCTCYRSANVEFTMNIVHVDSYIG